MRSLVGHFVVPLLGALLVMTTPVGTGEGVHQNELLHPVFPHVHLINGRIMSDDQLRAAEATPTVADQAQRGPAFGAGTGADAAGLGLALGPTLPAVDLFFGDLPLSRVCRDDQLAPAEYREPPLDPPPDSFV